MKRISQLDGLRAVAVMAVFIHHALGVRLLWMGVDLFFILSGFLITGILLDGKGRPLGSYFAHFYERRARRILYPYLLLLAVGSAVYGLSWTRYWYLYLLLTNFLLPLNVPHPQAFVPLWSLAVEEQFYLVWPFAVYFLSVRRLRQLCIVLFLLAPVLRYAFLFQSYWTVRMLTPFRMDLLVVGGLLCLAWRSRRAEIERYGNLAALLLCAVGVASLIAQWRLGFTVIGNSRWGNVLLYESSLFLCLGLMVHALGGRGVQWLCLKPVRYIGRISYTIYLIHSLILMLVQERLPGFLGVAVAFALTILFAGLSWSLVEKRLLSAKQPKPHVQPALA